VAPRLGRALTIGVSQSGQSPDVVAVVEAARRQGGLTVAITNHPGSPLAAASELCLPVGAGEERSIAATKTYSNGLLVLAMLSLALESEDAESGWGELARVPAAVEEVLASCRLLTEAAARFRDAREFLVLGRGFNYCTAFEIALKIKETSYIFAEPYSVADFLHGPAAMLDCNLPVMVVAPSGRGAEDMPQLVDLLGERGARVLVLSDREDLLARAEVPMRLPSGLPEWLSPIVCVVPGQLWARSLALAKGLDPDHPRGL